MGKKVCIWMTQHNMGSVQPPRSTIFFCGFTIRWVCGFMAYCTVMYCMYRLFFLRVLDLDGLCLCVLLGYADVVGGYGWICRWVYMEMGVEVNMEMEVEMDIDGDGSGDGGGDGDEGGYQYGYAYGGGDGDGDEDGH